MMIYELKQDEFERTRPFFHPLAAYLPFCAAVLSGTQPGRIWVDDPKQPTAGFMLTRDVWSYLAGSPQNEAFNNALQNAISEREIVDEKAFGLLLCCTEAWGEALTAVFPHPPTPYKRHRYLCHTFNNQWQDLLPDGFSLQQIDHSLKSLPNLPEDVQSVIDCCGPDDDPMQKGFGFVVLRENQVAAHVVVDCIVNRLGDVGLVTEEPFRRRGLATVASAAAIEYGLSHGLNTINWDCDAQNEGSIRTAEKLGFQLDSTHTMFFVKFVQN
ncbi:MAG: GNAT family N-acetyltransferase [Chloroflexi bacterium]|nr:MAG: GNAT family N-acetyltransferase [Chloroflexota bacterium]